MGHYKYKGKNSMEINLDLFYKLQECPKKFSLYVMNKKKSPSDLFKYNTKKILSMIISAHLLNQLKKASYYISFGESQIDKIDITKNTKIEYKAKLKQIITNFLLRYIHNNNINITGMGLPIGVTEYGLRVNTTHDLIYNNIKTNETTLVIFAFSENKTDRFIDKALLQAAIIYEGYQRNDLNINLIVHNLLTDVVFHYNKLEIHMDLMQTVKNTLLIGKGTYYKNITQACSWCTYREECLNSLGTKDSYEIRYNNTNQH